VIRKLFILLTVVFSFQAFSSEPTVLDLIRKKYNSKTTIQTQVDLVIYWSVREREEKKSGKLVVAPGDKFRVDLGSETLVSDGETYWQYSKKNSQVIIKHLDDIDLSWHPSQLLSKFLTGYSYQEKGKSGSETVLFWSAENDSESFYTDITVRAETKTGKIKKLRLTDRNGNIHTYIFKKTVFGVKIPVEVFRFEIPDEVQVHDDRQ
jgi:outer membrane lipoprotein-sorting protein